MKKTLSLFLALGMSVLSISSVNASETIYHYGDGTSGTTPPTSVQAAVGGFAVVNPETGVVHGVIVGSVAHFGNNDKTMNHEYASCPVGCLIVQQSTADKNGNVSGIHGPSITYDQNRNVFQSVVLDNRTRTILESESNSSTVETNINVVSDKVYEFGLLDYQNDQVNFTEIAPSQNTNAKISATTKQYFCEESTFLCSSDKSTSSNTLIDESVSFSERSTAIQVETKIITEGKNKIREQISLILTMLGKWIID
jgi:hypothetical protein